MVDAQANLERREFTSPASNIEQFDVFEGAYVADVGAGAGYYTLALAKIVGRHGRVYAIDLNRDLLDRLKAEAQRKKLENLEVIWGNAERVGGTKLRDASVDRIIASNILFQIEDRHSFAEEMKRILKPGGRILIVDWSDEAGRTHPARGNNIPKEGARKLFEQKGFIFDREIAAGSLHYGLIMRKL